MLEVLPWYCSKGLERKCSACSSVGIEKAGTFSSINGIQKGELCCQSGTQKGKGLEPPRIKLCTRLKSSHGHSRKKIIDKCMKK